MMPIVKPRLSAVQAIEYKRFAAMPTVPTLVRAHARENISVVFSRCAYKFFSHTRTTTIGTIGIEAIPYKSITYTAAIHKPTIGMPAAGYFDSMMGVDHG